MPTDEIIAAFEKLLRAKKRGAFKPTDRLGLERAPLSREFQNEPMPGYEKAAALIGAALSPGSTIASLALAPPAEETIFDRQIIGPNGKPTILPRTSESVVPKFRKQERAAIKPNPIVAAIQRHFQKGPTADPSNDLLNQKINDRDFLVHATRPSSGKSIRDAGGILPGAASEILPEKVLADPVIKEMIKNGKLDFFREPFSGKMQLMANEYLRYKLSPHKKVGKPGADPKVSPGVSLSRQMSVPSLDDDKTYRFLLNPKARKTFSTMEPGYEKAGIETPYKHGKWNRYESEQRTFGGPFPVPPETKALTFGKPILPTEEGIEPRKVDRYRATMGNETIQTIMERLGTTAKSREVLKSEYRALKKIADDLWDELQNKSLTPEYSKLVEKWTAAHTAQQEAFDKIYK